MPALRVPSETQPLLARKTEKRVFATSRSTLGVVTAAACGVVGLVALQRGGHAVPFLGAKPTSPDAALRTQAEAVRAAYYEGAAVSGDLQVRPFVRYGETGNLGSTGYEKCVGPDAKPVDGYHKTDAEAVRADLVFDPTTFREERASDAAVGDFGVSEEDVANVQCLEPIAFLFENVVECAAPHEGACDDDCGMVVPHDCEPGVKDFGSCSPTVNSVCAHMKDTSAACNVISATVKQSKIQYDAIAVGSNPCNGDAKTTAAGAQQAYKQALNKWSDAINAAGDVCTVGHGLWMYNADMYNTHHDAMQEVTQDLTDLCAQSDEFDVEAAIDEAKEDHIPTVRRRRLTWWRKDLCEPTIAALESITATFDVVTPELQCYAETCQKAIADEVTAFAELKSAHGAYKTAIDNYKDRAKTYNDAVTEKKALKASTLSALEGFKAVKQTEGDIFQRDLATFKRFDDGSDQGRCGLTECQLHTVCKHQIRDHFADFVNKDTCKAVPVSADNVCASETCPRFVTVTRTDGDGWGMDLKFKCGDKEVSVGSSQGKSKTVKVDGIVDGSCPSIVDQKNWFGGHEHSDTFTVSNGPCIQKAELAEGIYTIKGGRVGKYCADEGGKIVCDRDHVGGWEQFRIAKHGDWYSIAGRDGKFCADEQHTVKCDRGSVGGWERFNIDKIGDKYALRPDREHKYCADEPDGVKCDRDVAQGWELFTLEKPEPTGFTYSFIVGAENVDAYGSKNSAVIEQIELDGEVASPDQFVIHVAPDKSKCYHRLSGPTCHTMGFTDGDVMTHSNWQPSSARVGTKLFDIKTSKKVHTMKIWYYHPRTAPGWIIQENGVEVLHETQNRGAAFTPTPATYTYTLHP